MIPKKIHYFWVGDAPLPEKNKLCIESWKRYCPDYEIIQWDESNYDITKCAYMEQAYQSKVWGFVPDYARMDIIYQEGGIYLDTDVQIIRPLDGLLGHRAFMGFENKRSVAPGLGFGAECKNTLIKEMRDIYRDIPFIRKDRTLNILPSPVYATQILQAHGLRTNGKRQTIQDMELYPPEYFSPLSYTDGRLKITQNTYSIHWYQASWHTPEQKEQTRQTQMVNRICGPYLGKIVDKGLRGMKKAKKYLQRQRR